MHPFWSIVELVSEVVSLLPLADQAHIAQVHSALWKIAIPHIWRDITSIKPFINLFPPDLWNKAQERTIRRPMLNRALQDSDWTRFRLYSEKTRAILSYIGGDLLNLTPPEIWSHPLLSTSFPRLESFSVAYTKWESEELFKVTRALVRSSLRSIELTKLGVEDVSLVPILQAIAENRAVSLEEICSRSESNISALSDRGARVVASQTNLRRLVLKCISRIEELAERAEDFQLLEELDVQVPILRHRLPERHSNKKGFRSLTTLSVDGTPVENHHILSSIWSNRLTRVAVRFNSYLPERDQLYPEVIAELRRFRPHLAHLQILVLVTFSWTALEPALDLAELQSVALVHLRVAPGGGITDDRLRQMIDAWPNLTRLYIRGLLSYSPITLTSLAYIATHLPNLKKLGVLFDARKENNPLLSQDVCKSTFAENALEVFDVQRSNFDKGDENRVAKDLLRCWWPRAGLCICTMGPTLNTDWDIPADKSYSVPWPRSDEGSARHPFYN
ncbi:hypothetical protein FRC01_004124 [Tulasnella sp. 417]|nr:hypothetical protein FRC01_004124 [Tulasnella sp. 417]